MNYKIGKELDGLTLKKRLVCSSALLGINIDIVNNLNVFPVPDGDTGTNMKMTFDSGINQLTMDNKEEVGEVFSKLSRGMLLGARGNSGVILSQMVKGIANKVKECDTIDAKMLSESFEEGVKQSYKAVNTPVEGTMLTVFREATEYCSRYSYATIDDFLDAFIKEGENSLLRTPDLLPILKDSGVVDSGGAGLLYLLKGFINPEIEEDITKAKISAQMNKVVSNQYSFDENSDMSFGYCTEFLLQLLNKKIDVNEFKLDELIDKLKAIGGESIVGILDDKVVKIHVHTMTPGKVFEIAQEYGEFITLKVENMSLQHQESIVKNDYVKISDDNSKEVKKRRKLALVTVASYGFTTLFEGMGADYIVDGGQTMNPSSDDFIQAFNYVNSDNIIVLPNNSNIILSAMQAKDMYNSSNVYVIETKTLSEGYNALSIYNPDIDVDIIVKDMIKTINNSLTIEITKAVRDAVLNNVTIKKDNYFAFSRKNVLYASIDILEVIKNAILKIDDINTKSLITIFVGKDCNNINDKIEGIINEINPFIELYFIDTNQEIYDYIISIE